MTVATEATNPAFSNTTSIAMHHLRHLPLPIGKTLQYIVNPLLLTYRSCLLRTTSLQAQEFLIILHPVTLENSLSLELLPHPENPATTNL